MQKPTITPNRPFFSSGPCAKRPGWTVEALSNVCAGRSHRAAAGKSKLNEVITRTKALLGIPDDYLVGILPASDTGSVECAMWSMLGARGVDIFAWESFGNDWVTDATKQLNLDDLRVFKADYGYLPDMNAYEGARDCVFTWNGTTSGVCVPNADWIPGDREGITICDATSAVFAMHLPWDKLDVTTWSWQKAMGGEGAHGMLVLSPRAVERLENYTPERPLPKIFRLTKGGKINKGIFEGATINTPSMLCVEDALDSLAWMDAQGGLSAMVSRSRDNLSSIASWVSGSAWVAFLSDRDDTVSSTSICLKIKDPWYTNLPQEEQQTLVKKIVKILEKEHAALDIGGYRDAPAGLRVWGGCTVERQDIDALLPWLDWAYNEVKQGAKQAA